MRLVVEEAINGTLVLLLCSLTAILTLLPVAGVAFEGCGRVQNPFSEPDCGTGGYSQVVLHISSFEGHHIRH